MTVHQRNAKVFFSLEALEPFVCLQFGKGDDLNGVKDCSSLLTGMCIQETE